MKVKNTREFHKKIREQENRNPGTSESPSSNTRTCTPESKAKERKVLT